MLHDVMGVVVLCECDDLTKCCVVLITIITLYYEYLLILFMITHSCCNKVGICFYVKCVDHRLMQDLGSSPGTLFGCAPVRTQGPSHKNYGKLSRSLSLRLWKTKERE